jgi:hypothetical protein
MWVQAIGWRLVGYHMAELATALWVAALALAGKVAFDAFQRFEVRRSVASALAGEIHTYLHFLDPPVLGPAYRAKAELPREDRISWLKSLPVLPSSHPVFDKVADKIGSLPAGMAGGVARVYNVVTGGRLLLTSLSTPGFIEAPDHLQIERIETIWLLIDKQTKVFTDTIEQLEAVSQQSFLCYLCGCKP